MATIKKLKLRLKSGLLSELHSDIIFGHFAWRFKESHGESKLEEFLDFFVSGKPVFTISDGFLEKNNEIFFPKPLMVMPPKFDKKEKVSKILEFIKHKESKSKKLITLNQLNLFINNKIEEFEKEISEQSQVEYPAFKEDLRVSVEIDDETLKSKTGQLFTYNPKYLDADTFVAVFVKILDDEQWNKYNCSEILSDTFSIGYGKKKSSGYGEFEVVAFDDFNEFLEPTDSNGFINLSHFLPANNDKILDAHYDINVKYGKFGEEKSKLPNPFKPPLLLLKPGSCFISENSQEYYGRAVKGISDYFPKGVHNGIAFTLKAQL